MRFLCILLTGLLLHFQPALAQSADAARKALDDIDSIVTELTRISGFKRRREIRHDVVTKDHLNMFLQRRIKEMLKPEEIRAEELALKKFGFVPQDFNLERSTVDLITEQAAAFYDYKDKKLYLIDSAPAALQKTALVHELAHALADQHFNLEKFVNPGGRSDDSSLARMAVVEGQATWLMSEYMSQQAGGSLKGMPGLIEMISRSAEIPSGQFPVLDNSPLYMRETLLFPYTRGVAFQHTLIEKQGMAAFEEAFRNPPLTSQQVMHPELYFAGVRPVRVDLPEVPRPKDYKLVIGGGIGELEHNILLRQYVGAKEADAVAPGWRGAAFRLLESKDKKRTVLAYTSVWSDPSTAEEYFRLYQRVLAGKWKSFRADEEAGTLVKGQGDDGAFLLRLEGATVTSIEGLPVQ